MNKQNMRYLALAACAFGASGALADVSNGTSNTLISAASNAQTLGRTALHQLSVEQTGMQERRMGSVNVWGAATGTYTEMSDSGAASGYTMKSGGYALGMDRVGACATGGVMMGQQFGHLSPNGPERRSRIRQQATQIGLYGSMGSPFADYPFTLNAYGVYSDLSYRAGGYTGGSGAERAARWDSDAFAVGAVATWDYKLTEHVDMRPFMGVEYSYARMGSFFDGVGNYSGGDFGNLSGTVGVALSRTWAVGTEGSFTPIISVAYVGDMWRENAACSVEGVPYAFRDLGVDYGRHALQASASLNWKMSHKWAAGLSYTFEMRSSLTNHQMNLSATRSF